MELKTSVKQPIVGNPGSQWDKIRQELEKTQKLYTNDKFLDFLATLICVKEADRELLYKQLGG